MIEGATMVGTPQSDYAGQAADGSGRGRDRRRVTPTRLRTVLQVGILVVTGGVVLFGVLSANGML